MATLDAARKLGAKMVCTGHGPRSAGTVLDDQQAFFKALRQQVDVTMTNSPLEEAKARIESIRAMLKSNAQIARFVADRGTGADDGFPSQVAKVYEELTGFDLSGDPMPPAGTTACDGSRMNERFNAIAVREKYYFFAIRSKKRAASQFVND